jgi:hypothetical protein
MDLADVTAIDVINEFDLRDRVAVISISISFSVFGAGGSENVKKPDTIPLPRVARMLVSK